MASTQEPIRFATFNASLNRNSEGQLITDLSTQTNEQAQNVAEIIQRSNPDVVLVNEFDFEPNDAAAKLFQDNYLAVSQNGATPVDYSYRYVAPSNTGVASGFDLDNDGTVVTNPDDPGYGNDAFGFGAFPGQFGMVLYSKYPIDAENIRTFQNFLWKDMPDALLPDDPNTPAAKDWYSPAELEEFRLSSKSHWDVPINVDGKIIHALVSHPTPPVFDGDEDRNGKRNHDEIRFWSDYITPSKGSYIYDDNGKIGSLTSGASFVIMGDQNADPVDGDSTNNAILQLLDNPLINTSVTPDSNGGPDAAARQDAANDTHVGNPAFDTADFADTAPGNLRADYVLPSQNLEITDAAVFWPKSNDPLFRLVGDFDPALPGGFPSSDHRLVWTDVTVPNGRKTVSNVDFIGEVTFPTGLLFKGTEVGGLSGITYDPSKNLYYSISDDRSAINPARFYTLDINLSDGVNNGDVTFQNVTTLLNASGQPFPESSLDPESIRLTDKGTVFISSEGSVAATPQVDPFVNEFSLTGEQLRELPIPQKFLPTTGSGIRDNLAFESVAITPDQKFLYTATENALTQDGAIATTENGSPSRILKYNLVTGKPEAEFLYETAPVAAPPIPADQFSTNGLVELLALDNSGTLLALERSFSVGVGNNIKLYEVRLQGATDISGFDSVDGLEVGAVAQKRLLLDFAELGVPLDNIEGITLGPTLPDGQQSLVVVSDNNFSETQFTQFLAFAIDTNTIPEVLPALETPQVIDLDQPPNNQQPGDADDPAIYVHPTDTAKSLVIGTLKDGGLSVYDLNGQITQTISPDEPGDVRFNNVDLVYGFNLGNQSVDLAVASDRENDTLAIFKIDPTTRQLSNVTDDNITASIFGVDDGEQTAYGLATYTSPVSGKSYVFVSQREGNQVAQLELVDDGTGQVNANLVRSLTVPIPAGGVEDAQVEGMVADRELGYLYVGQEKGGIFKFSAEPGGGDTGDLIEAVKPDGSNLEADVEGLTIYYAADGKGYLLASSQGDSTYAAFTREGNNAYLGNFAIGKSGSVDSVEESDGADVINVPLGSQFPSGLLGVQDGSNEPAVVVNEDGEIENVSSNFKFVPWENVANAFPNPLGSDTTSFNPRNPTPTTLPNGVASGDTTQTSTVLWTRSTLIGEVTFEYSTDPDFSTIIGSATATVTDPLQPVKVQIKDLNPETDYYYRVTDAAEVKLGGQFTTASELGNQTGLVFGVSGDWRGELSPYPAISNADDRNLDFFVEHGDTIYADFESPVLPGVEQAETLEEYRLKHSEVYGDRSGLNTWSDLRASTSILATIDDHEVINDFAGGAPAASDPRFDTSKGLVNDTQLYENGLQAFQEYNPLRDEFYTEGDARTVGERQLYRSNTYGNDAATFVLDARSFRDAELPGVTNPADPTQVGAFLARSFDIDPLTGQPTPQRTLLGQQQLTDLKNDLLAADNNGVTWKFVMVPEPIQNLGVVGASDRFEGYAAERTDLLKFVDDNNIDNVVFVAADIHGTLVNNLTYQVGPGQEQIATNAFEVTTGAVAFDAPLGPTIVDIATLTGLIDPTTRAFYDSLPVANDADSAINDKDDFLKDLINRQIAPLGYDSLGLDGAAQIDATLLQGDYQATQTYGWTEFDIDELTQNLTVTTYGIDPYSEAELLANPNDITSRTPSIVSQFEVNPNLNVIDGTANADNLIGTAGSDRLNGFKGDDTITGLLSNDRLTGGGDNDTFVINLGDGIDTITDFGGIGTGGRPTPAEITEVDTVKFQGEGLIAQNMLLTQDEGDLIISFEDIEHTQVILNNFNLENLDNLQKPTKANPGNILFNGQNQIQDNFDVFNADSQRQRIFNHDSVTFLNDIDNTIKGFNRSQDVINGQGGNDTIRGLSGNDLLRGGAGNDTLSGGKGGDRLLGGDSDDLLNGGSGNDFFQGEMGQDTLIGGGGSDLFVLSDSQGVDTISDFTSQQDRIQLAGVAFEQLAITQGIGSNVNNATINILGQDIAILTGIQASSLDSNNFILV